MAAIYIMRYCAKNRFKIIALVKPSIHNTIAMRMSDANNAAAIYHSKHFRHRTKMVHLGVDSLGNRVGVASNRIPPRNF
jgi:flagellar biosynthesis/type III secretory pathway ATPase